MSIVIKTSIDINAPAKDVWAVLTDFPAYGQWSNFSKIDGVAQVDTQAMPIDCTRLTPSSMLDIRSKQMLELHENEK
jgi:hypothetical protein